MQQSALHEIKVGVSGVDKGELYIVCDKFWAGSTIIKCFILKESEYKSCTKKASITQHE